MAMSFKDWSEVKPDLNYFEYLGFEATIDGLIAYSEIFMPKLIDVGGAYFLKRRYDHLVHKQWIESGLSTQAIQKKMNMISMSWLFQGHESGVKDIENAMDIIERAWRCFIIVDGILIERHVSKDGECYITFFQ